MSVAESMEPADPRARMRALIASKPDGVVETIAREAGVSTLAVLEEMPGAARLVLPGARFEEVWRAMGAWGEVLFIVHTSDIVLECVGSLPAGSFGQGFYNIHGDSPIGGHIRAENCRAIVFVDRVFHGRRSLSVQFFNASGEAMFKVFVRRDKVRELLSVQAAQFEALAEQMAAGG